MPGKKEGEAMRPWKTLEPFARRISIGGGRELFAFDSAAGSPAKAASASAGQAAGKLPTLLLVHGLGDEADSWRGLFPLLSGEFRLIAPDLPGFGRSPARGRVSVGSCADALAGLLDAEAPEGAVLVGSSLGAALAELVAGRRPGLVRGLVLVDGGAPMGTGSSKGLAGALLPGLGERRYRALRGKPEAAYRSLYPYYADLGALPEGDRAFLAGRVVERVESDSQMRAYFSLFRSFILSLAFRSGHFRRVLAGFGGPVLLVWGGRDTIMPRATADLVASIAHNARIVDVEGAGHLVQQERPAVLAAAIESFLAGL